MNIKQFVLSNDVDYSNALIDETLLKQAESALGVKFGDELKTYLLQYGYLGYSFVEFYGMNSRQKLESDLVKQSLYLHKYFPKTQSYVVIENQGEGDYYLVDSQDTVYEFITETNNLIAKQMKLFDFIVSRFKCADNY